MFPKHDIINKKEIKKVKILSVPTFDLKTSGRKLKCKKVIKKK